MVRHDSAASQDKHTSQDQERRKAAIFAKEDVSVESIPNHDCAGGVIVDSVYDFSKTKKKSDRMGSTWP